jgi:hypothetical protein
MELRNIILSEVIQVRRQHATYFLSYMEYRPNTNISNIMKSRSHKGEVNNRRERVKEGS